MKVTITQGETKVYMENNKDKQPKADVMKDLILSLLWQMDKTKSDRKRIRTIHGALSGWIAMYGDE